MSDAAILKDVPTDELIAELRRRPGIVPSIWSTEDVTSLIEDEPDCAHLTEQQAEKLAIVFLETSGRALEDVLAERGNGFLADRWDDHKEHLLSEIRAAIATAETE